MARKTEQNQKQNETALLKQGMYVFAIIFLVFTVLIFYFANKTTDSSKKDVENVKIEMDNLKTNIAKGEEVNNQKIVKLEEVLKLTDTEAKKIVEQLNGIRKVIFEFMKSADAEFSKIRNEFNRVDNDIDDVNQSLKTKSQTEFIKFFAYTNLKQSILMGDNFDATLRVFENVAENDKDYKNIINYLNENNNVLSLDQLRQEYKNLSYELTADYIKPKDSLIIRGIYNFIFKFVKVRKVSPSENADSLLDKLAEAENKINENDLQEMEKILNSLDKEYKLKVDDFVKKLNAKINIDKIFLDLDKKFVKLIGKK